MLNRLTDKIDFHAQSLMLRSERQRLIASNIANADTPGYQARDFDFASALRQATQHLAKPRAARLGDPIMEGAGGASGLGAAPGAHDPVLKYATPAQTNLDSNTVDMDRERATFADNALRYQAALRFINGSLRTMQDAMKSPSQG